MSDVRPSVPRTPAQVTLRVVSAIMAILGGLVVLGAALVFLNRDQLGLAEQGMWTVLTYGGIILAAAALLLLTAWLGLRAADDSSRVGPYRFLCYFVGLVVLVARLGLGHGHVRAVQPRGAHYHRGLRARLLPAGRQGGRGARGGRQG